MIQSNRDHVDNISPVRHSNRRYSSVIKSRDLLHNYLVVPTTAYTHVRRKSIGKKKRREKIENKEKGYYIMPESCQS